jgi:hypothetical protein
MLSADAEGVWCESKPGLRYGIKWEEVYRIHGGKLDGITEVYTHIELDFDYGEYIEMYGDWPGFAQVVDAITKYMPGIASDWFRQVESLGTKDEPITVWERQH